MHPVPSNEAERLVELESLRLIDTAAAPEFDAVTSHLCTLFGVEKCTIALVDRDRLWFKSKIGIEVVDRARSGSFAEYTIMANDLVVIEDARLDARFNTLPMVAGEGGIRFYAGAPLSIRPGVAIGSLAVMDSRPHAITDDERKALAAMAAVVVALLKVHRLAAESEERRRALELREAQFKQTETIARLGGWDWELKTGRVTWSDEVYRIHDMPVGQAVGVADALVVYPPPERRRIEELVARCLNERCSFSEVFRIISLAGTPKWVQLAGDVEVVDGEVVRLFGITQDITEAHDAKQRLFEVAHTDALTGLANRHSFTNLLSRSFEKRGSLPGFGMLMIDVDHLKDVNDSLGHDAGDALIRCVSQRLIDCAGKDDVVARIGGDEFAMIARLDGVTGDLEVMARRIIEAMAPRLDFGGRAIAPQVSVGLAVPVAGDTPDTLRQKADIALYHAKDVRRGGFVAFAETLRSSISTRMETSRLLDEALAEGRVLAHYQPIINLRTGRIEGLEALARLKMPDGTFRSAGEFASALDDSRNAVRLTSTMLRAVTRDLAAWRRSGLTVGRVGINATTADFRDGDLDQRVVSTFEQAGLPLNLVTIEVTETVFLSQVAHEVGRTLVSLRSHGVRVALDDFGTGHASLANLGSLPVDVIKVDRGFVARMAQHKVSEAIVKALIDLGEVLDISVVAEGVETEEQLLRLQRMGCNAGQGYLFSRPLPPSDVATFVRAFGKSRLAPIGKSQVHFVA